MTTTLTFRNTVSAFVRKRNRWESAVPIPIQTEESLLPREGELYKMSTVKVPAQCVHSILRRP
jgi:hypothetical protein